MESTSPTTTSASLDSWLEPSKYLKPENQQVRSIVRRLIPKECCRLMLIPDDHPFVDGDATSDSAVYKLQGNGWARNQSRWVFKRQHEVDEKFITGHRKQFKFGTISSGQGTHELSVEDFGDISLFASEIDPFPCRVIAERFPNTVNFGDMTRIDYDAEKGVAHNRVYEGYQPMSKDTLGFQPYDAPYAEIPLKYGEIDVISGGTPCFVAGSMVLTDKGYKPIEEIKVGDLVVTHLGNLKRVEKVGRKISNDIYRVKAVSRSEVLVTGNHPFLSMKLGRDNVRTSPTYSRTIPKGAIEWKEVRNLDAKCDYLSIPRFDGTVNPPSLPKVYNATEEQIYELIGWYLGDGYIRKFKGKNKKAIVLCLNANKVNKFRDRFGSVLTFTESKEETAVKITMYCTAFAEFLLREFGHLATGKNLPAWVVCGDMRLKELIWKGYMSTDGTVKGRNERACSVSKSLVLGFVDMLHHACFFDLPEREASSIIQGRKVDCHHAYEVQITRGATRNFHEYEAWTFVKPTCIEKTDRKEYVYNIQVADDHSYICNGYCVHNCTDVSVAGKRSGATEGSNTRSSLAFTLPRLGNALGARWLTFENVAGILSSNGGKDFGWFLFRVMQAGYTIAWRTLDAQVTFCDMAPRAVPQRRMRIWMVAYRGDDWRIPCRVLFEPMKVLGTEPPRRIVGRGFLNADPTFNPDEAEFLDVYKKKKGADDGARGDLFSMFFGEPEPDDYAHYKPRKLTRAEVEVAFPDEADIRNVKPADMVRFMRTVGFSDKGMYAGPLFTGDKDWRNGEVTPDDLAKGFLENLGTGGIISNGFAATLKMPTWNAGITEEELAEMDEALRELYDGTVCGLSDVLYRDVDGKYRLSWRACWGIIVRAETRGKRLPELLEDALLWQIAWNPEHVKWAMLNAKNEEERGKAEDCWKRVIEPNAALYVCPLDEIVPESPKKAEDDSADEDDDEGDETETDEFADEAVSQYCDEGESAEGPGDEA